MGRRKKGGPRELPALMVEKVKPPVAVALGSPGEVALTLESLKQSGVTSWQFDRFPADLIEDAQAEKPQDERAQVAVTPDFWDLPADFQSVVYVPARAGERELKIDVVEQAWHVLRPHGQLLVWSPYENDALFPPLLKKVFGRVSSFPLGDTTVFVCQREGDRPRRRHEVTFHARIGEGPSCHFVSRPGVFAYGRFDLGARAMMEVAELSPGQRVLDLGCGCGTNGVLAWQRVGPDGHVTFVDSNSRATALAELNARHNGVAHFDIVTSARAEGLAEKSYDVVLANPPYFAQGAIAKLFLEQAGRLLRPEGRCYLVTKSPNEMAALMEEVLGAVEIVLHRNYFVLSSG